MSGLWEVAIHECGHCVAIAVQGGRIEKVVVSDEGGYCRWEKRSLSNFQAGVATICGGLSVVQLCHDFSVFSDAYGRDDRLYIDGLHLTMDQQDEAKRTAFAIIESFSGDIVQMAYALEKSGELSGDDVSRILGRESAGASSSFGSLPMTAVGIRGQVLGKLGPLIQSGQSFIF